MAVDYRQLDVVSKFGGFLDMLQNADKMRSMIDEAKKVLDEEKSRIGSRKILAEAEKYSAAMKKEYDEKFTALANKEAQIKANIDASNAELAKKEAEITKLRNAADSRVAETQEKLEAAEKYQAAIKAELDLAVVKTSALSLRAQQLDAREALLNTKADKIQKFLNINSILEG